MKTPLAAFFLVTSMVVPCPAKGQTEARPAHGRVVDARTGEPVRFARVEVKQANSGVVSGADGRFSLVLSEERQVQVGALGYVPRTLALGPGAGEVVIRLEPTALSLTAVTVTATPSGRGTGEVAAPVSVMGTRDVERSLGATLATTLSREPGITMRSQGPSAAMPIIRGLTGDRIVVLQDGQRTADLASSASDHGVTIDPLAAREIEVVRGPAALLYGSNALGGVVNVISDDIPRLVPERRIVSLSLSGETATAGGGTLVDITQPIGDRLALTVRGGGRAHGNQGIGGPHGGELGNTSARNRSFVAGLGYVGASNAGGATYRRYGFEYGLPVRDDPAAGVRLRGGRHEVSGRWQTEALPALQQLRVEGTTQWYDHDEVLTTGDVATALELGTQQLQVVGVTRARGLFAGGAVGAGFLRRENGVAGDQALTPPNAARALSVVAFQDLAPFAGRRVRLPLAVRLERSDISSRTTSAFGPSLSRRFDAVSASGGLVVPTGSATTLALNVARAVRAPGAEELFSRAGHAGTGAFEIGNPQLDPEVTHGLDLVWRADRPQVRWQAALFHTAVQGWIGMYPTGRDTLVSAGGISKSLPLFTVSQVPARLTGGELLIEQAIGSWVLGGSGDVVLARDQSGNALPFMPPMRLGVTTRRETARWQLGSSARYTFGQGRVAAGEEATGGFLLTDAFAGVRFGLGASFHTVLLRIDNVADRWSRDATSRAKDFAANPGRSVSLTWKLSL